MRTSLLRLHRARLRQQPHPRRRVERHKSAQREPARRWTQRNRVPPVGDQQQPVERSEMIRQTCHVTDAEAFPPPFAQCGGQHQSRRNPRETGDADLRERDRQQQPCKDCQKVAAPQQWAAPEFIHPLQLAWKASKGKFPYSPQPALLCASQGFALHGNTARIPPLSTPNRHAISVRPAAIWRGSFSLISLCAVRAGDLSSGQT